jgi:broad specificity phosphatase PhoE
MLFKRKCKITFVAHGATIYTDENRICDKESHPPLNEVGQEEAEKIAKWVALRSPQVDKIYTGASLSCVQTANFLAKEYNQDFEILPELKNQEFGIWKGLTFNEIEKRFPEMLKKYHDLTSSFAPEGGESLLDFGNRVEDTVNKIITDNLTRRIVIVTHSNFIRAAIRNALNLPAENQNRVFVPTGSATQIKYYKSWNILMYSGHVPLQ